MVIIIFKRKNLKVANYFIIIIIGIIINNKMLNSIMVVINID